MVPWPTAHVEIPFVQPLMVSSTQQSSENQDRFVAFNAGQCMPPSNNQALNQHQSLPMQVQQPQQPFQQNGYVDPWAAMTAPPAPATMAPPHQQSSPPLSMVVHNNSNQAANSPTGDGNVNVAQENSSNATQIAAVPTNPFDFCYVASSLPAAAPPSNMPPFSNNMNMLPPPNMPPPPAPPSPPRDPVAVNQQQFASQLQAQQFSQFGYATSATSGQLTSPPLSPTQAFSTALPESNGYGATPTFQLTTSPPMSSAAALSPTPHPGVADSPTMQKATAPSTALVPQYGLAPQQAYDDPFGYAFSPIASPITSPNGSPGAGSGALVPSASCNADPFGVLPPYMPGTQEPNTTQTMVPSVASVNDDPFGVFDNFPIPAASNANPSESFELVTSGVVDSDPFGLFGKPTPAEIMPSQLPVAHQSSSRTSPLEGDLLGGVGFDPVPSQPHATSFNTGNSKPEEKPITLDSNNLPSEGEYYEARIAARTLGAMFYSARNLDSTLLYKMPNNVMEALGSRPVVAYVAENSAANIAGVHLGHVVLSVNGHEVADSEHCGKLIRSMSRPIHLRCYIPPDLQLTSSEGNFRVKYDTKDFNVPANAIEWKEKFVVVGGIVAKPWMINMFYKKRDYDVAVKEVHAGYQISVKVKQFDLRGARVILKGKDGKLDSVEYHGKRYHYLTIVPDKGYPIKISSTSLEELEPVYAAIRRFVKRDMENRYLSLMQESYESMRDGPGGHSSAPNTYWNYK